MTQESRVKRNIPEPASPCGSSNEPTKAEILEGKNQYPVLEFHVDKYLEHIKDIDMSDDEAREYLRTYFEILVAFVDLNFDLHPVCQALEISDDTSNPLAPELASLVEGELQREEENNKKEDSTHGID